MRSVKVFWSAAVAVLNQATRAILSLVVRRVFLIYISAEFLGLNTLFGSVISFLSLSELGVGTAIMICLYKPLTEHDYKKANAYIRLLRYFNYIMMTIVLVGGVCLIPVVFSIVNGSYDAGTVLKTYLLYLLGTALSYLWSCYSTLLTADQKAYKVTIICWICTTVVNIIQIITIVLYRNYYIYLWTQLIYSLVSNFLIRRIAKNEYVWLEEKTGFLTKEEKKDFAYRIKDLFIYRIASYLIQSLDNIIVSVMLGTVVVAYYGNYYLIVNMLYAIIGNIGSAAIAGMGNVYYAEDEEKTFSVMKNILFVQHILFSATAIATVILANDFVRACFGNESVCSSDLVIALAILYYLQGIISALENVRTVVGCYDDKYWQLAVSMLNVIISIVLTYKFGLSGVVIGTIICYLIKAFVLTPKIVFGNAISNVYRKEYMRDVCCVSGSFIIAIVFSVFIPNMDMLSFPVRFVFKGFLAVCGVTVLNWILLRHTGFYKENREYFMGLFGLWIDKFNKRKKTM